MVAMKRRAEDVSSEEVMKKLKKLSESGTQIPSYSTNPVQNESMVDMSSPQAVLASLLKPHSLQSFFADVWEKKPLYIKRDCPEYYGNAFGREAFLEIVEKKELLFEVDVNACRYVDEEKEMMNGDEIITKEMAVKLFDEDNATIQFHQPQRFSDILWCIMEKMETYFGNLVGSNVYMTPPKSQGLAPHCDDVEAIILQVEGTKSWRIYEPQVELSRDYTQDLSQDDIGKPILEVELKPGDLLYFPRGYIHQAISGDKFSTHITISTYHNNTIGDFLTHAVSNAIENGLEDDVSFRRGLPINFPSFLGSSHDLGKYIQYDRDDLVQSPSKKNNQNANGCTDDVSLPSNVTNEKVKAFKELIKEQLSKLIDHCDINIAADAMADDFFASRLPPFRTVANTDELDNVVKVPSLKDMIRLQYREHASIVYEDDDEEEEEDDEADTEAEEAEEEGEDEDSDDEMEEEKNGDAEINNEEVDKIQDNKKREKSTASSRSSRSSVESRYMLLEDTKLRIKHSLHNDRETHMMTSSNEKAKVIKLEPQYARAVKHLFTETDFTRVSDLPDVSEEEQIHLATVLSSEGLLEIQSPITAES